MNLKESYLNMKKTLSVNKKPDNVNNKTAKLFEAGFAISDPYIYTDTSDGNYAGIHDYQYLREENGIIYTETVVYNLVIKNGKTIKNTYSHNKETVSDRWGNLGQEWNEMKQIYSVESKLELDAHYKKLRVEGTVSKIFTEKVLNDIFTFSNDYEQYTDAIEATISANYKADERDIIIHYLSSRYMTEIALNRAKTAIIRQKIARAEEKMISKPHHVVNNLLMAKLRKSVWYYNFTGELPVTDYEASAIELTVKEIVNQSKIIKFFSTEKLTDFSSCLFSLADTVFIIDAIKGKRVKNIGNLRIIYK